VAPARLAPISQHGGIAGEPAELGKPMLVHQDREEPATAK